MRGEMSKSFVRDAMRTGLVTRTTDRFPSMSMKGYGYATIVDGQGLCVNDQSRRLGLRTRVQNQSLRGYRERRWRSLNVAASRCRS